MVGVTSAAPLSCYQAQTGSAIVTIAVPFAGISGSTTICTGTSTTITFTGTPNATVAYKINGVSGETVGLDVSGNYLLATPNLTINTTYELESVTLSGTPPCTATATGTVAIMVNQLAEQNLVFSYADWCVNNVVSPSPILTSGFATGGVYSSAELNVNPATGVISLIGATEGTYDVTYTLQPNTQTCTAGGVYTATITLKPGITPVTVFDYPSTFCSGSDNVMPTLSPGFTSGGVFTSVPSGLNINGVTGEVNIGLSQPGTYTITYTINPDFVVTCNSGGTSSDGITVLSPIDLVFKESCDGHNLIVDVNHIDGANYSWIYLGDNAQYSSSSFINIGQFMDEHPEYILPLTFEVTMEIGGCTYTEIYTVDSDPCLLIPRGISPNGDGKNDSLDLTDLGVDELIIFNRYGVKAFTYTGKYTNQFEGLSDNKEKLPDGTYFYSIHTSKGTTKTGWIYINREY